MKRFTKLFFELDQTTRVNEKVSALENYFRSVPPADAAWALHFLCGRKLDRAVAAKSLWHWIADQSGFPSWLIEECYNAVGDGAETMALLLRDSGDGTALSLSQLVETRLLPLRTLPEQARRDLLVQTWRELNAGERLVWNKLITGNFRVGVARTLVIRALASSVQIEPAVMAHRVLGAWKPTADDFARLIDRGSETFELARPYPFFLASPLELKVKRGEDLAALGDFQDWIAEWKWDGIRAQLIRRGGETLLWSRGDEMITDSFPEIIEAGNHLPDGTVLDGELLAWRGDAPLPFAKLQRRLGRKQVGAKTRADFPIAFVAYDLLESRAKDIRSENLVSRRAELERVVGELKQVWKNRSSSKRVFTPETLPLPGFESMSARHLIENFECPVRLSPLIEAESWEELGQLRKKARARGVEGVMLKNKSSTYGVGRQRGEWWKWKIDPFVIDAVLVSAQLGHGRRASLYTDYTFGLWQNGRLVPVAKAYSGLTDEEILRVDAFVRQNTTDKFGPVRAVKPIQVFELAFEGIQKSTRHKSGVAVRFPRMNRWRHDKKPAEADTLENLKALANFEPGTA